MTFFEVEQIDVFLDSLERHLDQWLFSRRDMQMLLAELKRIEKKLQTAGGSDRCSSSLPAFCELLDDLRHRTAECRNCIRERLLA